MVYPLHMVRVVEYGRAPEGCPSRRGFYKFISPIVALYKRTSSSGALTIVTAPFYGSERERLCPLEKFPMGEFPPPPPS